MASQYHSAKHLCHRIKSITDQNNVFFSETYFITDPDLSIIQEKKILLCSLVDIIDNDKTFWERLNNDAVIHKKKIYVLTDSILDLDKFSKFTNIKFKSVKELFGLVPKISFPIIDSPPKKLFEASFKRVTLLRLILLYELHLRCMIDQGHVSFLFEGDKTAEHIGLSPLEILDVIHKDYSLDDYFRPNGEANYHLAHTHIRKKIPYVNINSEDDIDLLSSESKYPLALETYIGYDQSLPAYMIYEKSFRPLQLPQSPLILAEPGTLKQFKNIGFDIPDYLTPLDENHQEADLRIHQLLDILENDSINESWETRRDRAVHNRELLLSWEEKINDDSFLQQILQELWKEN